MPDKILRCQQCGSQFYFTEGEQRFYKSKGLNIPKYCKNCRGKKQQQREIRYTPKACSTCYFLDFQDYYVIEEDWDGYDVKKLITPDRAYCRRSNRWLADDEPCQYWTKDT